jgi:HEAT repeat protein
LFPIPPFGILSAFLFLPFREDTAMIRFHCPKCDAGLKSTDEKANTKTACPRCGERFLIPAASQEDKPVKKPVSAPHDQAEDAPARPKRPKSGGSAPVNRGSAKKEKQEKAATSPLVYVGVGAGVCVLAVAIGVGVYFFTRPPESQKSLLLAQNSQRIMDGATVTVPDRPRGAVSGMPPAPTTTPEPTNPNPTTSKPPDSAPPEPPQAPAPAGGAEGDKVYNRLLRSTAWIVVNLGGGRATTGSGALVDRARKLILTNHHVISLSRPDNTFVFFPAYEKGKVTAERDAYIQMMFKREAGIPARVVRAHQTVDLALVELGAPVPDHIQALPISRNTVTPGQGVHSMGNPGVSGALWVYTPGTVRSVYHKKWAAGDATHVNEYEAEVIEAASATNPGDSGGPLVNNRKELVGVTHGTHREAALMSLFIDASEVRKFLATYYKDKGLKPPEDAPASAEEASDVTSLVKALGDADAAVRARTASALRQMGPPAKAAVPALVNALKDKDEGVRKNAADALEDIGSLKHTHLATLTGALKDSNPEIRSAVASIIAKMGAEGEGAVGALCEVVKGDAEPGVRQKAAVALGKMGPVAKEAVSILAAALKDKSSEVRIEVALALGQVGPEAKAAVADLVGALKDSSKEVKLNALTALGAIGPDAKAARAPIGKILNKERDQEVRLRAIAALGEIGGKESAGDLIGMFEFSDLQAKTVEALAKLGKNAVPELIKALGNSRPAVRLGAAEALGKIGLDAEKALPELKKMARFEKSAPVREAAGIAVEKIQSR